ncbi:MAG: urease accessory protein UreE [Candidatus Thiodiazotropha taylori]
MIKLTRKIDQAEQVETTLTLPLQSRIKSRLRVTLDDGRDAGLLLPRGTTLKEGDLLATDSGMVIRIKAADETLSIVESDDTHLLSRACYHLGNRHVSIQIEAGRISYPHDHVLDEMLAGLGLKVAIAEAPFEPEPGAYGGSADQGHSHAHHH